MASAVGDGVIGDALARAVRPGQRERHAHDARLAAVLDAVGVGVVPDEVADRYLLVVAEVDRQVAEPPGKVPGVVPEGLGLLSMARFVPWSVGEAK